MTTLATDIERASSGLKVMAPERAAAREIVFHAERLTLEAFVDFLQGRPATLAEVEAFLRRWHKGK